MYVYTSMNQIREQVKKEDVTVKAKTTHHSQTDASKGFGGKFGVLKERQDKVRQCASSLSPCVCVSFLCL